ncbi:MAG: hypothetical protein HQ517_16485 [SAR324 cluster bacterium]|nr:hypothetical protein [SAR324 cluster bacterium]
MSALILYIAASSLVLKPTSRLGSLFLGSESSSFDSPTGLTFAAQPQVLERLNKVFFLNGFKLTINIPCKLP